MDKQDNLNRYLYDTVREALKRYHYCSERTEKIAHTEVMEALRYVEEKISSDVPLNF